jgi:hypothetical protein
MQPLSSSKGLLQKLTAIEHIVFGLGENVRLDALTIGASVSYFVFEGAKVAYPLFVEDSAYAGGSYFASLGVG